MSTRLRSVCTQKGELPLDIHTLGLAVLDLRRNGRRGGNTVYSMLSAL
jgi:hypothetical protein